MQKENRKEFYRTAKFVIFSISAGIIEILSFTLLNELARLPYWTSYLIALILSVLWNFTLNRRYTFQSAANVPVAMLKVFGYYCVFMPISTYLGNYLVVALLWNEYAVTGLNMACNLVTEFLFDKHVVYRNTLDTNEVAARERQRAKS
jgi:putative flippase GtrA